MDLKILPGAAGVGSMQATAARAPVRGAPAAGGASFANALDSALKSVSQSQQEASAMQRQFQVGAASLEDTMVAMQKAQVGFQAALTVRNRLVSAYSDIMNIQV